MKKNTLKFTIKHSFRSIQKQNKTFLISCHKVLTWIQFSSIFKFPSYMLPDNQQNVLVIDLKNEIKIQEILFHVEEKYKILL